MKPTKIRISLNDLRPGVSQDLMTLFSSSGVEVLRVFDENRALGSDDLILCGDLEVITSRIVSLVGRLRSIKFSDVDGRKIAGILEDHGLSMRYGDLVMIFGAALIPFDRFTPIIPFTDFDHYFKALQATRFGSEALPFLPVKPRGLVYVDNDSIEFMRPCQSIPTLQTWVNYLLIQGSPDIETLVDVVLGPTNPFLVTTAKQFTKWAKTNSNQVLELAARADVADYVQLYSSVASVV